MEKCINIYSAIGYLPDELITREIYEAGIKEGNIKLLDILPEEYLTEENINKIIDKNKRGWDSFSLSAIPDKARTRKICESAVELSLGNYPEVPVEKRSNKMLLKLMDSIEKCIHFLPLVPKTLWDDNAVYTGIKSIYSSGNDSSYYNSSRYYSRSGSSDKKEQMRLIQILLAYVPESLKTKSFYLGLFQINLKMEHIDFLTPKKYKNAAYYLEAGRKEVVQVPLAKLNYQIIKEAMLSGKNADYCFFDEKYGIKDKVLAGMDNELADMVAQRFPEWLKKLPAKFHTNKRLALAIDNYSGRSNLSCVYSGFDVTTFNEDVCRAIVRKEPYDHPQFPDEIWTPDFIDFCWENAGSYYWFGKMPVRLQTQKLVNDVLKYRTGDIQYVRPDLISYKIAMEAYRIRDDWSGSITYGKYVPSHYLENFHLETGLPKEFFGGERTYSELREEKENYTYCKIGDCYIGYFIHKDGRDKYHRLLMARRSPMQIKPSIVFNRTIGTYHKTWFEKLVADNDPLFVKPIPPKGLKGKQINPYFNVKIADTVHGIKVYAHTFLDVALLFTAHKEENFFRTESLDEMKRKLKETGEQVGLAG